MLRGLPWLCGPLNNSKVMKIVESAMGTRRVAFQSRGPEVD